MSDKRLIFVLGGARGGKSAHAEKLAADLSGDVLFVATSQPGDEEMRERIARHRARRPKAWRTLEAPLGVGAAIRGAGPSDVVLLDCLTVLVANVLMEHQVDDIPTGEAKAAATAEVEALLEAYRAGCTTWIVVSNEVGMGLVPDYPLGRAYRDLLGRANQRLAEAADEVILMVAGLAWRLKPGHEQRD
jgi:adenosylcobinamide kinase/adenosylcobinamide-phosphate guanylyltransferase